MKRKIKIVKADPAGNITIFVRDKFEREQYRNIAEQLLHMDELNAEQVSFIKEISRCGRADGKMEMSGMEFCGNGSRSFALLKAKDMGIKGKTRIFVDVSGCNEILTVDVDTETGYTRIKMPLPDDMCEVDLSELGIELCDKTMSGGKDAGDVLIGDKVDFDGITHIVLKGAVPSAENFEVIKNYVMQRYNPLAAGVMFCDGNSSIDMVPVVYVRDLKTTYFEGSCGSGSVAAALAFAKNLPDGTHKFCFMQPAGEIDSSVVCKKGVVQAVYIEGIVKLFEEAEVEVEV